MNELEKLRQKSALRREHVRQYKETKPDVVTAYADSAEDDLNHAIALAEEYRKQVSMRDILLKMHMDMNEATEQDIAKCELERDQARTDVLMLREHIGCVYQDCELCSQAMIDTQSYEAYKGDSA